METKIFKIKPGFAKFQKLPIFFAGVILNETQKAVYMYGKGTTETTRMGICCICGRELTHPVSVELGVGPICGGHEHNWDLVGGYTLENIERLKKVVREKIYVDGWLPRSVIIEELPTNEIIEIPTDHKMLNSKTKEIKKQRKFASLQKYQNSGKLAIKIEFPFDMSTVNQVKTISGRKFHGNSNPKFWTAPLSLDAIEKLLEFGFEIDDHLHKFLEKSKIHVDDMQEINIPGLKGELFPFQKKGVSFLEAKNGRGLIADEMGLGKTVQALAYLQLHIEKRPVIIVVPASLKLNWQKEAEKWLPDPKVQIITGGNTNAPIIGEIIIINYDILPNKYELYTDAAGKKKEKEIPKTGWVDYLIETKPQVLIMDEVHYTKNNAAKRTKAVKKLGKNIPHVIALSGTPIVNRPVEIFNALHLIDSSAVPTFWEYAQRYCGAKNNGFGWDFSGASNTQELHEKLTNTIMIRRKKEDVLTDLPAKIRSFIPIELSNQKEYNKAETNFVEYVKNQTEVDLLIQLRKNLGKELAEMVNVDDRKLERLKKEKVSKVNVLTEIEELKQLAVKGKMKQSIEWIKDFLDVDGKLVVFATHKMVIDRLMEEFKDVAVKIDGSVSSANRNKAVTQFQNNPKIKLFVGNIKAAGVGITLTAASNVVFLELPWTPGDVVQAEDRCHRIGQKNSVTIHYLLAVGTIEQKIAELLDKKRKVLDNVLDGEVTEQESLLTELMKEFYV